MILVQYLTFLKEHYPDELAVENLRLYRTKDIPLFRFFAHIKDPEFLEGTRKGILKLINDFEQGREYEALREGIARWMNNETEGFSKDQVTVDDLINIYGAQKEAILHFVHLYTAEAVVAVQLFKEIEAYYNTAYRLAVDAFVKIHNEELQASERKYRLLAENSSDIIARQQPDGIITYVSPACLQVLGYEPAEMTGQNADVFLHPEDLVAANNLRKTQDERVVKVSAVRMRHKDGKYVWVEVTVKNILSAEGDIIEIHTSSRDISRRMATQERLRQNEHLLAESQRIARMGSWEWDVATHELTWTPGHYELYGMEAKTARINYADGVNMRHPDDTARVQEAIRHTLTTQAPLYITHRIVVNGIVKNVEVKGEAIVQDGVVVKLRGTSQDVTSITQIRQEIEDRNHQLEEAQQLAHLGSWEWNVASERVTWSDEMFRIFGYEPGSVVVDFKFYLNRIFPMDRERVERYVNDCNTNGAPYSFEHRIITRDGHIKWLQASGKVAEYTDGKAALLSGTALDITERKTASLLLDEKVIDLEKSNSDLQLYASIASHDLKEPLRKIKTNASILTDIYTNEPEGKLKKHLDRIVSSATRMEKLIEDVLSVSRVSGKRDNFERTNLNTIVQQCLSDLEHRIKERNVNVVVGTLPSDLVLNPNQMHQLFQNLISNAIKFNDKDLPEIRISAEEVRGGRKHSRFDRFWDITVQDNGIGFDQHYADKIFVMFQRLHEKERYDGNGIGLAICKKIMENHDGFIAAQGEQGKGTTFTISLPSRQEKFAYI